MSCRRNRLIFALLCLLLLPFLDGCAVQGDRKEPSGEIPEGEVLAAEDEEFDLYLYNLMEQEETRQYRETWAWNWRPAQHLAAVDGLDFSWEIDGRYALWQEASENPYVQNFFLLYDKQEDLAARLPEMEDHCRIVPVCGRYIVFINREALLFDSNFTFLKKTAGAPPGLGRLGLVSGRRPGGPRRRICIGLLGVDRPERPHLHVPMVR